MIAYLEAGHQIAPGIGDVEPIIAKATIKLIDIDPAIQVVIASPAFDPVRVLHGDQIAPRFGQLPVKRHIQAIGGTSCTGQAQSVLAGRQPRE